MLHEAACHGPPPAITREVSLHWAVEVPALLEEVVAVLTGLGYSARDRMAVRLALEEALLNALRHGNGGDPSKCVHCTYRAHPRALLVDVVDEGRGFDPNLVPDPTLPENLERPCGRGLLLMRHAMTWVCYSRRGNRVTLCKRPSASAASTPADQLKPLS
jgi:serine/threonine-protein kinase RsbW